MIELEHNGERYMVENGQWYRRLKVGEVVNFVNQMRSPLDGKWLQCSVLISGIVSSCEVNNYRVPCTDPRPQFFVGQRVKVARLEGQGNRDLLNRVGTVRGNSSNGEPFIWFEEIRSRFDGFDPVPETGLYLDPWCLDPVEPTFGENIIDRLEKFTEQLESGDIDPELDHILRKLKPLTDRAADVRRIMRECYQKLAALLPEEMR